MRRFVSFGPAFVVLLAVVVSLVAVPAAIRKIGYARADVNIRLARADLDQDNILDQINKAVRNVASAVEPSVVHIAVEGTVAGMGRERISQGSGWVYDQKGHIVTNAHVVRGMRGEPRISVQFSDGRTTVGTIVAVDNTTDIAVLKVPETDGVFAARRATGIEVAQGDRVYAFGSPFGFKFSMSEGIISGLGRSPNAVLDPGGYTNFIQTDAAVNPGNSGGPLVDVYGRVVGMNVAIATGTTPNGTTEGQNSGISFAIPLDTIESVVVQLISGGTVSKGYMGIRLPEDPHARGNNDVNEEFNRTQVQAKGYLGRGVIITRVTLGSPAAEAGIKDGDILTLIHGKPVTSIAAARQLITINHPGEKVPVKVWRDGKIIDVDVVLGDLAKAVAELKKSADALNDFGVRFGDATDDSGVYVNFVAPTGSAYASGLRIGQLVNNVDGQKITDTTNLLALTAQTGFVNGRTMNMTVTDQSGRKSKIELQYRP